MSLKVGFDGDCIPMIRFTDHYRYMITDLLSNVRALLIKPGSAKLDTSNYTLHNRVVIEPE